MNLFEALKLGAKPHAIQPGGEGQSNSGNSMRIAPGTDIVVLKGRKSNYPWVGVAHDKIHLILTSAGWPDGSTRFALFVIAKPNPKTEHHPAEGGSLFSI